MVMSGRSFTSDDYRFGFNGKEDESAIATNNYDFGARIYEGRIGRWLSVDPLMKENPNMSPYNFCANSPIVMVDPDGRDNIVYLVLLPKSTAQLKKSGVRKLEKTLNKMYKDLGLHTEVRIFEDEAPIDPRNLDPTDSFVVIGENQEAINYYQDNDLENKPTTAANPNGHVVHSMGVELGRMKEEKNLVENAAMLHQDSSPFLSGGGCGAIADINRISELAKRCKLDQNTTLALVTLHVTLGHNSNQPHWGKTIAPIAMAAYAWILMFNPQGGPVLTEEGVPVFPDKNAKSISINEFLRRSMMDVSFYSRAQERFGIKDAKDNYKSNKKKRSNQ